MGPPKLVSSTVYKLPCRFQVVNLNIWDKPAWFSGLSPLNKVPVIAEPDGKILCESLVVAEYLDAVYTSGTQLLSTDPYKRAREMILVERIMAAVSEKTIKWFIWMPVFVATQTGEKRSLPNHPRGTMPTTR